jgi:hemin uptake protein HemP
MNDSPAETVPSPSDAKSIASLRLHQVEWESSALFQGARLVIIHHRGEQYRLIETRNGKLILQK